MERQEKGKDSRACGSAAVEQTENRQRVALDRSLFGGILWTAGSKYSSQLLTWASLVVVIRYVPPADFGLVGLAGVYLDVANIIGQFGFGSAAINLRDLTDFQLKQMNAFAVLSSILMLGISCAAAAPLGLFFHSPRLPLVVIVMSVTMLAGGIQTIPYSLLQRQLRFKLLSVSQTVTYLIGSLCTLFLAIMGWGYWALVVGYLVNAILSAAVAVICEPRGFAWPRLNSIEHALRFSWHLLVARLSWSFYNDSDKLVAGRVLGTAVLGQYSLAWNLATMPVEKVTSLVGQVTRPIFAARQTDYVELRRYLLLLTEGLSVVTFPMGIGLALTANDAVPLIFGKTWVGAVAPLQILAFFGCAASVSALIVPLLTSLRDTRYVMQINVAAAFLMPIAFYLGSYWGAGGVAASWIIAYPIILLALGRRALRSIGLSGSSYARALGPATSGVAVMALAVTVVKYGVPAGTSAWARLIVEIALGAASYGGALLLLHGHRVRSLAGWYRRMRAGEEPAI